MEVDIHRSGHGFDWSTFNLQRNKLCCCTASYGISFIELITLLSVVSLMSAIALPRFSQLMAQERTAIFINRITGSLAYARSEAVNRRQTIVSCQSKDKKVCNISKNWHEGWIIFVDLNNNVQHDENEEILSIYPAAQNGIHATFEGAMNHDHYIKYTAEGFAFPNGSFYICHPDYGRGKALILHRTGRLRLSQQTTKNQAITCGR